MALRAAQCKHDARYIIILYKQCSAFNAVQVAACMPAAVSRPAVG